MNCPGKPIFISLCPRLRFGPATERKAWWPPVAKRQRRQPAKTARGPGGRSYSEAPCSGPESLRPPARGIAKGPRAGFSWACSAHGRAGTPWPAGVTGAAAGPCASEPAPQAQKRTYAEGAAGGTTGASLRGSGHASTVRYGSNSIRHTTSSALCCRTCAIRRPSPSSNHFR